MRSTSWLCLLALLVLASPALSQSEPAAAPVPAPVLQDDTLIDEAYGFSVQAPGPDWKWAETENPRGRSFTVESPDGAHLLFVAAADEPLPQGKGDFMKGYVTGLREPLEKTGWTFKYSHYEPSKIPVEGSYRLVMPMSSPDGEEMTFFSYVVPRGRMYSLHVFSRDGNEPPALRTLASSFKLLDPPAPAESPRVDSNQGAFVFYGYLIILGIVMGICWIINKILGRPKINGAWIGFFLIALLALLRLLLVLGSLDSVSDPGAQGEAFGRWAAETAFALVIAYLSARQFKKKKQEAALAKQSVETFS